MLELKDDVEYPDIVDAAMRLCNFVINNHKIKTYEEVRCPYFRTLIKEMYREVEEDAN